jgi:hypothetical protein
MSNMRVAAVLALTFALGACDRTTSREIAAPEHVAPLLNAAPDGGIGTTLDGPFDEVLTDEAPSAEQAATGGRATGHVGFHRRILGIAAEKYSFSALSTAPPPPLDAKGQFEVHLTTVLGSDQMAHADVICLSVVGNRARIAARLTKAFVNNAPFPLPPGGLFSFWTVTDNGEGNGPPDLASLARFTISEAAARFHCAVGFMLEQVPIDEGNVQVSSK